MSEATRTRTTATATTTVIDRARGGVSGGAILTGVVVAFGAMFILTAIIGAVLAGIGVEEAEITTGEAIDAGIGAGMALVLAQFLSYLWGGYTAGRMGRGAGFLNGLLVPIVAILVAVLVGAVVAGLGEATNLNLPFQTSRLPLENDYLVDWGLGIGVAALAAMFLGAILGGALGARWHSKLERRAEEEAAEDSTYGAGTGTGSLTGDRTIDARDRAVERHPTTPLRR